MISVCIATFNGEKYLREEIESILPQLGPDDEVIVSDDGSTDHTLDILESFDDKRIKIFHHKKSEVKPEFRFDYTTHNFGNAISKASGDIIFLADQDDVWMPDKVQAMTEALQTADIAVSDCIVVDKDLKEKLPSRYHGKRPTAKIVKNLISCNNPGCCIAFRRSVADAILPFPPTGVAHDFWIIVFGATRFKITFLPTPLILFRRHDGNVSASLGKSTDTVSYRIKYRLHCMFQLMKHAGLPRFISNLF